MAPPVEHDHRVDLGGRREAQQRRPMARRPNGKTSPRVCAGAERVVSPSDETTKGCYPSEATN